MLGLAALALLAPGWSGGTASGAEAGGEKLHGRLELVAKGGKGPSRDSDPRAAVVYFVPNQPVPAPRPPDKPFKLVTRDKDFIPRVLVVPRGSRVQFPNEDPISHNVFSLSPGNAFDFGIYRQGVVKEKRFETPGLVRVYCNVHVGMVAYIQVLETPYYTTPAADGSFTLTGLPRGAGRLSVWHEQTETWTSPVAVPSEAPIVARLEIVNPRVPPHLNKAGESYFRSNRDRYDRR